MSEHVIEFDGKRYDANTGAYLGKSQVIPKHITDHIVHGKAIDGFVRSQPNPKAPVVKQKAAKPKATDPKSKITVRSVTKQDITPVNHLGAHHPQRSTTLARRHTHKPETKMKTAISKAHAPAEVMAKPQSALVHKNSVYSIDQHRLQRATLAGKHHAVKHFTTPAIHSVSAAVPVIAVQPAPLQLAAPQPHIAAQHHNHIFESAIARATSHEQPEHKVRRRRSGKRRLVNSLAIVATFLVIGGFVTYLNLPGIEMRVASVQAGFGASLPTYAPTGYALQGGVQRSGSTVSVSFRSGSSHYRITQQVSNWDSQTLLDDMLALNGQYKTVQKNGQTIYIYGESDTNATWVNGGVRYDLTGNAELSSDEITSIATSL